MGEAIIKTFVILPLVTHNGIDDDLALGRGESVKEISDNLDLLFGAQIAGTNGIEAQPKALPMGGYGRNVRGKVMISVALKTCASMGGEHCRGDYTGLNAHG